jgi:hypothetical protein
MNARSVPRILAVLAGVVAVSAALSGAVPASATPAGADAKSATVAAAPGAAPAAAQSRQGLPAPARKGASLGNGPVTQLVPQDGACDLYADGTGELCLWFFADFSGSYADYYTNESDLRDNTFLTPGPGLGQTVANNAESGWNRDLIFTAVVWTDPFFTGVSGTVAPGAWGNFNSTFKNNVESISWV